MAQLTLKTEEIQALILLLEGSLPELSYEIADTDQMEFRNRLKERRDLLQTALDKLKQVEE